MHGDELIARWIEPNPNRPGADEVRLVERGVSVWAIIGEYVAADGYIDQVMQDYAVSRESVEAALAYYRRHECIIDNRLAANAVGSISGGDIEAVSYDPCTRVGVRT